MDYSKLSDQEINLLVAKIEHPGRKIIESKSRPPSVLMLDGVNTWFDYINNPANTWPIILDNRIAVIPAINTEKWAANNDDWDIYHTDDNPLRACMIVFLMMQENKNG